MPDQSTAFRGLHERFFVMPNPFDAGTARLLADLGFKAIASSSAALAWSHGRPDGLIDRRVAIAHAADLSTVSGLPVNGDFEAGYGETPAEVAETIAAAIDAGIAGGSIEDLTQGRAEPLYDTRMACQRIEAARETVERSGSDFVLTARCEVYFTPDPMKLRTAVDRLSAYASAGAHVVYAPKLTTEDEVAAVVAAATANGAAVNVLAGLGGVSDDLAVLERLGVRRVSLGSGLARAALGAFLDAAGALADGKIALGNAASSARLNEIFARRLPR